jgi:hypothetical protein
MVAVMMGGTLASPALAGMLDGQTKPLGQPSTLFFDPAKENLLAEIAEVIIPTTDTPGAKAAGVGPFINLMISDCYTPADQAIFAKGLIKIERDAKAAFGKPFAELSLEQKTALLKIAEADAIDNQKAGIKEPQFFRMAKELTLLGYFTSEIGCTQALAYEWIPGRYDGCVTLKTGQKPWAT